MPAMYGGNRFVARNAIVTAGLKCAEMRLNAETMIDPATHGPHTYHTTNPVPFIVVDEEKRPLRQGGALQDIAPTILAMLGVAQPKEMTGRDLRAGRKQ